MFYVYKLIRAYILFYVYKVVRYIGIENALYLVMFALVILLCRLLYALIWKQEKIGEYYVTNILLFILLIVLPIGNWGSPEEYHPFRIDLLTGSILLVRSLILCVRIKKSWKEEPHDIASVNSNNITSILFMIAIIYFYYDFNIIHETEILMFALSMLVYFGYLCYYDIKKRNQKGHETRQ